MIPEVNNPVRPDGRLGSDPFFRCLRYGRNYVCLRKVKERRLAVTQAAKTEAEDTPPVDIRKAIRSRRFQANNVNT